MWSLVDYTNLTRSHHQLPQVETVGDAYMVVGGLPERSPIHAECVANQALDMMYYCQQVKRPDTDEPIVVCILLCTF